MTDDKRITKQDIRSQVRSARDKISPSDYISLANGLSKNLRRLVAKYGARTVTCFYPAGNEPDTREFLIWAHLLDITVLMPVSLADGNLGWSFFDPDQEKTGRFGIREWDSSAEAERALASCELFIIPACAVSSEGIRLGWGKGYYDRMLAGLDPSQPVYAVIYDEEVIDGIPAESHDVAVSGFVTPTRITDLIA